MAPRLFARDIATTVLPAFADLGTAIANRRRTEAQNEAERRRERIAREQKARVEQQRKEDQRLAAERDQAAMQARGVNQARSNLIRMELESLPRNSPLYLAELERAGLGAAPSLPDPMADLERARRDQEATARAEIGAVPRIMPEMAPGVPRVPTTAAPSTPSTPLGVSVPQAPAAPPAAPTLPVRGTPEGDAADARRAAELAESGVMSPEGAKVFLRAFPTASNLSPQEIAPDLVRDIESSIDILRRANAGDAQAQQQARALAQQQPTLVNQAIQVLKGQ